MLEKLYRTAMLIGVCSCMRLLEIFSTSLSLLQVHLIRCRDAGQHNTQQRIQHHMKVKEENNALRADVARLHDEVARQSSR